MSAIGIASSLASSLFGAANSSADNAVWSSSGLASGAGQKYQDSAFSSSLAASLATMRAQTFNTLIKSADGGRSTSGAALELLETSRTQAASRIEPPATGLSANGRNLSLFDPESAYRMMSIINNYDATYKAQYSELTDMKNMLSSLQTLAEQLGQLELNGSPDETGGTSGDASALEAQLTAFTAQYNRWIDRFQNTVGRDGLLAGTQAAEVSLHELEQSVQNVFNGARDGFHGMSDLGLTIDPNSNLAVLSTDQLHAALANNPMGAGNTVREFGNSFAKSTELLISPNNIIPNRLDNLERVIGYVADNKSSLQAEFGLGDPARPSDQVKNALISYYRMSTL